MATIFRLMMVALVIVLYAKYHAEKVGTAIAMPSGHTLIALSIFAGFIFASWSLDSIAEALKGVASAWREFNETVKSMKKANGEN